MPHTNDQRKESNMKKKLIALLLVLMVAVPAIASCNGGDTSDAVSSDQSGTADAEFPLEYRNFEGQTVVFLTVADSRHPYGVNQLVAIDEKTGSVINDAVAERNNYIEENYGIKIETATADYPGNEVANFIAGGVETYDVIVDSVYTTVPRITENHYYCLDDLLHLEGDWWDRNALEYLSANGSAYLVAGDILLCDDMYTYLLLYNKDIYNDSGLAGEYGTIYDIVDDGEWTYDLLHKMAKSVSQPDSDGNWTNVNCTYGFLGDAYGSSMMVAGSGVTTVELDADNEYRLVVGEQKSIDAFSKVYELMSDTTSSIYVEQITESWGGISSMFMNDKGLFYLCQAASIFGIKASDNEKVVNFGVVPLPKYDENQEKYYSGINAYQSEVLGIPTSNINNLEATCYALEAMAYYAKYPSAGKSVTESFYETTLKLQAVASDDDARMLDLIFDNRLYDLGGIYNWGGNLIGVYSVVLRSGSNNLVSYWDSIKGGCQASMEETIEDYRDMTGN